MTSASSSNAATVSPASTQPASSFVRCSSSPEESLSSPRNRRRRLGSMIAAPSRPVVSSSSSVRRFILRVPARRCRGDPGTLSRRHGGIRSRCQKYFFYEVRGDRGVAYTLVGSGDLHGGGCAASTLKYLVDIVGVMEVTTKDPTCTWCGGWHKQEEGASFDRCSCRLC